MSASTPSVDACLVPEIVTFDEVLARAEWILELSEDDVERTPT
jgi:hypothetical protein